MLVKTLERPGRLLELGETQNLKSGFVILEKGSAVGEHITEKREEIIVILEGVATVTCEGEAQTVEAKHLVYIPEGKTHNLRNDGDAPLAYIYIVCRTP